ncbi:MAG: outer membrane protein transport protein [Crocinitomicaceae bacterium]
MSRLILVALLLPFAGLGQGYQVNLQGQIQQGMGGAGTALMQDASALFFNPAGASFIDRSEVTLGMTPTFAKGNFVENSTNVSDGTTSPVGTPFSAYGLFQIKDSSRLKLGIAVYTPFGSTVEWEEGWVGRFALTRLALKAIFFQPTVSFRLTDKIGIGAGFVYSYGKVNLQKDLPLQDQDGEYAHVELAGSGHGFGYNVGLYFEPTKRLSFGITYRSQVDMNITSGTATFTVPASVDEKFPSGSFTSSLPLPQVLTFGLGVQANEKLALALDANYVGWNAYDTLAFDYENNTESLEDTKSARNYENTIAVRMGGQYKFTPKISARLGLAFAITPVQDGYVTPETPDANRINYTAGFGYKLNDKFQFDLSLLFTQVKRTDTNLETGLSGTFKTRVLAPGFSLSYGLY